MSPYTDNSLLFLQMKIDRLEKRIKELEATLERVKALPQKWRSTEKSHDGVRCHAWKVCADELEDELSGIQGKALDGELSKPDCDMVDTDLCKHYQKQPECHYDSTHYVKCLKEKS